MTLALNMTAAHPTYRSKTEAAFAQMAVALMTAMLDDAVIVVLYEPLTFRLPGGSYTPDFMALTEHGRAAFVEVKGSRHQRNYRDARSKLRAAAELHPWFEWFEALPAGGGNWDITKV
jgi:hypothetical protein